MAVQECPRRRGEQTCAGVRGTRNAPLLYECNRWSAGFQVIDGSGWQPVGVEAGIGGWAAARCAVDEGSQFVDLGGELVDIAAGDGLGGFFGFADAVDEPAGDGGGDYAEQGDAADHEPGGDEAAFAGDRVAVAVSHGGH